MGLFDFVKDIGNKIFGSDDDAGEKLKQHVEADNPGVSNLEVQVDGDTATIKGEADSPSAMEKTVLMVGNAMGISNVEASELKYPETEVAQSQFYVIKKGDTLWGIAKEFYGDGTKHELIFAANREVIKDPDKIFPGQKIRIPAESE